MQTTEFWSCCITKIIWATNNLLRHDFKALFPALRYNIFISYLLFRGGDLKKFRTKSVCAEAFIKRNPVNFLMLAGNFCHPRGFIGLKLYLCRGQNSATMTVGGANQLLSPLSCFISILHSVLVALRIFWKCFLHQHGIGDGKIQFHVETHCELQGGI